ncbi:hypothetical protein RND81_12G054300 [Saponaria officinalis]|uniref:Prolamin-like domain-containing protein n=1 Tax=Saponaria officinalis TaxID=3572 RepID=A0AAW1H3K7_SAPOF
MESKTESSLSLSVTTLLLTLFVMVRQGASNEFGVAQSLARYNELQKCENELGVKCGNNIYQSVFVVGKEVSEECCNHLLTVGKDCHDLLTEVTIVYKRLPRKEAKEIWNKNDKVWEQCKKSGTTAPIPERSNELLKCENGLGKKCGHSIYQHVFESAKGVSEKCCSRLKIVGKDCHDLLTEVTIVYKRLTIKQAREVWSKNDQVWEHCQTTEDVTL